VIATFTPVLALFIVNVTVAIAAGLAIVLVEYLAGVYGSAAEAGMMVGAGVFAAILARFAAASVADRFGSLRVGVAAATAAAVGFLGLATLEPGALLLGAILLTLSGQAVCVSSIMTLAHAQAGQESRYAAVNIVATGGLVGFVLGAMCADLVGSHFNHMTLAPSVLFYFGAVLTLVAGLLLTQLRVPVTAGAASPRAFIGLRISYSLLALAILSGAAVRATEWCYPLVVGARNGRLAGFFAGALVIAILARFLFRKRATDARTRRLIGLGIVAIGVSLLVIAANQSVPVLIFAGTLFGLGKGLLYPSIALLGGNRSGQAGSAAGVGQALGGFAMGEALGIVIAGHFFERFTVASVLTAGGLGLALIGLVLLARRQQVLFESRAQSVAVAPPSGVGEHPPRPAIDVELRNEISH
jgi:MFS family permease